MPLSPGDAAPWFNARTPSNPEFVFDTAAGRYVLLAFLPKDAAARRKALQVLTFHNGWFDDVRLSAFAVARDAETAASVRDMRGLRWFLDAEGAISRLFGAEDAAGNDRAHWLLLDPTLRALAWSPIEAPDHFFHIISELPPPEAHAGLAVDAPVLVVPRVFDPRFCEALIERHAAGQTRMTGVMRDEGEVTVTVMDELKKRRDLLIRDEALQAEIRRRLKTKLFPVVQRALSFQATRIERYLVSAYDVDEGGVFHPHRDNLTHATVHRKFACSINLNADFEGGDLRFPEFGTRTYRPPLGGAVVFGCGLLHEATRVTAGRRYAFLPFLYDEAGEALREAYEAKVAQARDVETPAGRSGG
jgi:predicted 2-oxoglutarate/Fe(II)-dependent dioxygenase YbiX/peroxiredoxin